MTHRRQLLFIAAILVVVIGMSILVDVFCLATTSLFIGVTLAVALEHTTLPWWQ